MIDNMNEPIAEGYDNWISQEQGLFNHFTPYGIIQEESYLPLNVSSLTSKLVGRTYGEFYHHETCYDIEILPVQEKLLWKPPKDLSELPAFYTDGGFRTPKGTWAYWPVNIPCKADSGAFSPCSSSTAAEEKAFAKATSKALSCFKTSISLPPKIYFLTD